MKRYCLALDLQEDAQLIAEYEAYHQQVWTSVLKSIKESGIISMEIYRLGNRLFMIAETEDDFSWEKKAEIDAQNSEVQAWEKLMWQYQKALPMAKEGEKWLLMEKIFELN
jgi:L-rhamnose mutarotase